MPHRGLRLGLAIVIASAAGALHAAAQTAPAQLFGVCASQPTLPTIYVSGVLQATAASAAGLRTEFTQFLAQRYGYKGAVVCQPLANAALAEQFLKQHTTAARNAKKNVIETGWVGSAAPAAALAGMLPNLARTGSQGPAAAPAATPAAASATAGSNGASGGSASSGGSGSSDLARVLSTLFSGCAGSAGTKSQAPATNDASGSANGGAGASGGGGGAGGSSGSSASSSGGGCALTQVSSALSGAFAQKPASGAGSGAHTAADGLGSAQAQNTRLVVYGCGRQDTQIACVTELTNQDKTDTLVQSADVWKDTFIVDDRGDRHARSRGFFINIDGDQRPQLDISYGNSARLILMFDDVQPRVQKVTLRSQTGGLDVEDIPLLTSGTATANSH